MTARLALPLLLLAACGEACDSNPTPTAAAPDAQHVDDRFAFPADPEAKRRELIEFVFRDGTIPNAPPEATETNISVDLFTETPNLARIDTVRFDIGLGLWSLMYVFHPEDHNGQAVIYHPGHGHTLSGGAHAVDYLVERGYLVLFAFMPLFGPNPGDLEVEYKGETFYLRRWHDDLLPIEQRGGNTFHLFFEPVARGVAYLQRDLGIEQIAMIGLSGGGWTTDVYSAIDPRVRLTYNVSGSVPFHLRTTERDRGEYEQLPERPFYELIDYMGLYFLAAQGEGQGHRQHSHEFDACCYDFRGRAEAFREYERAVQDRLQSDPLGGDFRVELMDGLDGHNTKVEDLEIVDREMTALRAD